MRCIWCGQPATRVMQGMSMCDGCNGGCAIVALGVVVLLLAIVITAKLFGG